MSDYDYPPLRQRVQSLIDQIKSTLLLPIRIATSKLAIRTYLTSLLFFLTSFFLLAIAIAAYTAFYWSYIPRIGFTRQIHLQYDHPHTSSSSSDLHLPHPWGTAALSPDFASQQLYDITIHLTLPRTPENTKQGNFMLDASLLGPQPTPGSPSSSSSSPTLPQISNLITNTVSNNEAQILARSRRTAFLTYYSREIDLARKALLLPVYLTGLSLETEDVSVQVFEGVSFPRGWRNLPSVLRLEIQSQGPRIQIYDCNVSFRARFRGLRWIMYNHRVLSATVFVSAFWITEVGAMGVAWLVLSFIVFPKVDQAGIKSEKGVKRIKQEEEERDDDDEAEEDSDGHGQAKLSDTERTFPSYASQPLLRYQSTKNEEGVAADGKRIKLEERDGEGLEPFPPLALQTGPEAADDEDEEDDYVLDSGLGTSLESSAGGRRESGVRRRKSGQGRVRS